MPSFTLPPFITLPPFTMPQAPSLPTVFSQPAPVILGHCDEEFAHVRELFSKGFHDGSEAEAQLCVYHEGRIVVDLWGVADPKGSKYDGDSLQIVFSSTKTITAIVFACLVDRGLLDYSDLVAAHWPEFASNGKSHLRVCDVLRHECGLVHLDKTVMFEEMLPENIKKNAIGAAIEREAPSFPPPESGTDREYHGLTRGWILNEIFRRVEPSGRTIGEFLREEISGPLSADAYIGVKEDQLCRMADIKGWKVRKVAMEAFWPHAWGRRIEPSALDLYRVMRRLRRKKMGSGVKRVPVIEDMDKVTPNKFIPLFNRSVIRMGETPSGNGSCSARGMAKLGACVLAGGALGQVRIMSRETCDQMHDKLVAKRDYGMTGMVTDFSQGGINLYRLSDGDGAHHRKEKELREGFYGWMGFGGSVFQWNKELDVSFAYAPTLLSWYDLQNLRGARLQKAVSDCVAKMRRKEAAAVKNL